MEHTAVPGFDGINLNTPYRADMRRRVTDVLCLSAVTIKSLIHDWRDVEGLDVRPGKSWVKRLLHGMRLSYKKPAQCVIELHSPEQQHANTHRLFVMLCWLMSTHAVSADRVLNIDDTSCRLLPVHQIGWGPPRRKTSARKGGHDIHGRLQHGPWPAGQAGADRAVGQDRRRLAGATLAGAHSSRHVRLATTTTLQQLAATLDDVMNPSKVGLARVLLWDMASVHASEATLAAVKAAFPHVVLCFIPPRSTSYLRPCDVAVFRSFKSCIQGQASATLARSATDGSFEGLAMNKA